jgi:hypothetical protein
MTAKERIAIYIDGSNFYQRIREAGIPRGSKFDYSALAHFLSRGRQLVSKRYYVGIVRNHDHTAKSQQLVDHQQRFLANLEAEGYAIERGRIVYDHKIREKGWVSPKKNGDTVRWRSMHLSTAAGPKNGRPRGHSSIPSTPNSGLPLIRAPRDPMQSADNSSPNVTTVSAKVGAIIACSATLRMAE